MGRGVMGGGVMRGGVMGTNRKNVLSTLVRARCAEGGAAGCAHDESSVQTLESI
jgi:hypothetical protein